MTVSTEVIEIFNYIGEKIGVAIDWSNANVIPYLETLCSRYITYEIATSIMWEIIFLALLIISVTALKKSISMVFKDEDYIGLVIASGMFGVVAIPGGLAGIVAQTEDIIKCICVPELQIYEMITKLVSSK